MKDKIPIQAHGLAIHRKENKVAFVMEKVWVKRLILCKRDRSDTPSSEYAQDCWVVSHQLTDSLIASI